MVIKQRKIKAHNSSFILCTLIFTFSLLFARQSAGSQAAGQIRDPYSKALSDLEMVNPTALRRAIADLIKTFGADYPDGQDYLKALDVYEKRLPAIKDALKRTSRGNIFPKRNFRKMNWQRRKRLWMFSWPKKAKNF